MNQVSEHAEGNAAFLDPERKAIFLDKDGTLMEDIPYNSDPNQFRFGEGVAAGLTELARAGFSLFVVSNQSGVGRGYFSFDRLAPMEAELKRMFAQSGLKLEAVAWCPHFPGGGDPSYGVDCLCRKPHPGMLLALAAKHKLNLSASWMVGDRWSDVEAGEAAGCRSAWLSAEPLPAGARAPQVHEPSFSELAKKIIGYNVWQK